MTIYNLKIKYHFGLIVTDERLGATDVADPERSHHPLFFPLRIDARAFYGLGKFFSRALHSESFF